VDQILEVNKLLINFLSYDALSYIYLGQLLFLISLFGLLVVKNYILFLLLIDLGLLSAAYNMIIFASILGNEYGYVHSLFLLVLITVDTAVGLSLVLVMDRMFKNTSLVQTSRFFLE
jgi:NADH:ubiquinone oxidoreductase subunit K